MKKSLIKRITKIAFGKEYKDKLDQKILNNKILWGIALFMVLVNSLSIYGYLNLQANNHVKLNIPKVNYAEGEQIVASDFANDTHYLSWGMYHIIGLSNFSNKNIRTKLNEITKYMPADSYALKKNELDSFEKSVIDNSIVSYFRIPNIINKNKEKISDGWNVYKKDKKNKFGVDEWTVIARGDIKKKYGFSYEDPVKKCDMEINYYRYGGFTYVANFGTDCF